jgi:hypothetical protein
VPYVLSVVRSYFKPYRSTHVLRGVSHKRLGSLPSKLQRSGLPFRPLGAVGPLGIIIPTLGAISNVPRDYAMDHRVQYGQEREGPTCGILNR